ncbi:MAG: hypothetical protein E6767_12050 [Dysgonomonas sp.]|nr:hypothetical protein [Dysgonomonas sp.]
MKTHLGEYISEYHEQMEVGIVPRAYKALMEYMMKLRTYFMDQYPDEFTVGSLYQGYMDITFFTFTPRAVKDKSLKVAIVFNHEKLHFEVWLVGQNKQMQEQYWKLFKDNSWNTYPIADTPKDAILQAIIVRHPDFDDLDLLTELIERETVRFINYIGEYLN